MNVVIDNEFELVITDNPRCRISISQANQADWCLALCSLKDDIIETIIIKSNNTSLEITRNKARNKKSKDIPIQVDELGTVTKLRISSDALGSFLRFYLSKYYQLSQDFVHIDIDVPVNDAIPQRMAMTFS